jgi:hypothetical protein
MKDYKKMWELLKQHFEGSNQTFWSIQLLQFIIKDIENGKMDYLYKPKK